MIANLINWKVIYNLPALFHIYLTERGRGKSDTKGWEFLEIITTTKETSLAWIRRRWHDSLIATKPFFQSLIYSFCEEKKINPDHFEIRVDQDQFSTKEQGVFYKGLLRIHFYDLFSYQRVRGAIARTFFQEIVFEEAIPIDQEFLCVGGRTEQWMFHDLISSLEGRKDKQGKPLVTKLTLLANPYSWSSWFLDVFKNLFDYKREAEWESKKGDNSGVLQTAKDEEGNEWLLYINLIEGEDKPLSRSLREKPNPFQVNWDDFMISLHTKNGKLKKYQIEHAIQDFFFCELGEREKNKKYFLMHFSKNKKEVDQDTVNFCFNLEEEAKSKFSECLLRDKSKLVRNWVHMLKDGELFFSDFRARDWFLEQIRS